MLHSLSLSSALKESETSEECEASAGGNLGQVTAERRSVNEGTTPGTPISLSSD